MQSLSSVVRVWEKDFDGSLNTKLQLVDTGNMLGLVAFLLCVALPKKDRNYGIDSQAESESKE